MTQTLRAPAFLPLFIAATFFAFPSQGMAQKPVQEQGEKFNTLLYYMNRMYVDSVDLDGLVETAIRGMLEELDPHSVYIPAEDLKQADEPEHLPEGAGLDGGLVEAPHLLALVPLAHEGEGVQVLHDGAGGGEHAHAAVLDLGVAEPGDGLVRSEVGEAEGIPLLAELDGVGLGEDGLAGHAGVRGCGGSRGRGGLLLGSLLGSLGLLDGLLDGLVLLVLLGILVLLDGLLHVLTVGALRLRVGSLDDSRLRLLFALLLALFLVVVDVSQEEVLLAVVRYLD